MGDHNDAFFGAELSGGCGHRFVLRVSTNTRLTGFSCQGQGYEK